jgi:ABC-type dipeptide/oligopeptide/nickel transport system permease component
MLEVLRQEYVVTARAKGLAPPMVVVRHALKNALIATSRSFKAPYSSPPARMCW